MSLLSDIWAVLSPRQRRWIVGAQLISIVMAFSTVAGIASIAPFFSVLGNPGLVERNRLLRALYVQFGFTRPDSFTIALGIGFLALVLLANLINILGSLLMTRLAYGIGSDLQTILFAEYLHRPYAFHARTPSAQLYNNIIQETTRATTQILQNALALNTNIVTALFIVATVTVLNPAVAGSMILALAGGYALIYLAMRNRLLQAGRAQSQLFIELTQTVNESLGAIREILVLGAQEFFRRRFAHSSQGFARAAARALLAAQSPRYVMECVAVAGLVVVALLSSMGKGGEVPLGELTFLGFAAYRLLPALQQAFAAIVRIRADRPGFSAVAADLRLARNRRNPDVAADPTWAAAPESQIVLQDVSFHYDPQRAPAVSQLSLRIPARGCIGLVGANGSGKTTVVDLIAGLLVPESGWITVDGTRLNEANRAAWRRRIAYVPQSCYLLDASIAQNVAFGIDSGSVNRERLLEAAGLAQLDEFVAALPGGYDHTVGERGVWLSGGQRQRLGIARALYAEASVLILDEATNALDGLTEQELMATIARLRGSYTILLIAHRLSTVRDCDLIVELDRGSVVASGTYTELLGKSETFRRMVDAAV